MTAVGEHSGRNDDWDQHWEHYADAAEVNPAQAYRRRLILNLLEAGPGTHVVDIGSGQGDLAATLDRAYPSAIIVGLELSAIGVTRARGKVPSARFEQVNLLNDPVNASLEGWATHAVCSEVLEHVDDPSVLLGRARAYLAPSARLVVTVPGGPRTQFDRSIGHRRHFTRQRLRDVLDGAGFTVEGVWAAGFPFFNIYKLLILLGGKRMVQGVRSGGDIETSWLARTLLWLFNGLFRLNIRSTPFGWQLVAVATSRRGDPATTRQTATEHSPA